ncbi:hypothetical protein GCM10009837_83340 [Streptomyces durmitorensis]|uniref:Neutral metalloproteinase n=1 Tax=Streptomyces durmitorensis TaxID=319947 RepID=A0ABY4PZD8_9ACTN|nr:M4 family metallopeptidase [Streptomyces durmitorensis]UQT59207.1 M4 family metallopeptidase [Streptomyces durmitorensis]
MDSGLLAAIVGTAGAGLGTAGGAWWRGHTSVRTAARLVYAELTRDSAAVVYFRMTGHWAAPALPRVAWDAHGEAIARRRNSASFESVHRGYEALEIIPALADDTIDEYVRDQLLREPVNWLLGAIKELGKIAKVSPEQIRETTQRLNGPYTAAGRLALSPKFRTGVIPLSLQERIAVMGTEIWQVSESSQSTSRPPKPRSAARTVKSGTLQVIYDAKNRKSEFVVARTTGDSATGDAAVDETYEALAAITDYCKTVLERDQLLPKPLCAVVHYAVKENNAWWDGEQVIVGDGDEETFGRFSQSLDLIAHTVWHSLDEVQSFGYFGESGALNESFCDVFGLLVKQHRYAHLAAETDWVFGRGLLMPERTGIGLRSLREPGSAYDDDLLGKDSQPAHMDGYVRTGRDNGGVHINSGIPNHSFYLLAVDLGGYAWERAGRIWWDALVGEEGRKDLKFTDWARRTVAAAASRYGEDGEEHRAVIASWEGVGVPITTDD